MCLSRFPQNWLLTYDIIGASLAWAVDSFLAAGVPANKLMLGLANYGRTFLLTEDGDQPGVVTADGECGRLSVLQFTSLLHCFIADALHAADSSLSSFSHFI